MDENNCTYNCLGTMLNDKITYISVSMEQNLNKDHYLKNVTILDKEVVVCIGISKLYFLLNDFEVKDSFEYKQVKEVLIDTVNTYRTMIILENSKKIMINVKNRNELIKNLFCYYSIFYMEVYGEIKEIELRIVNFDEEFNYNKQISVKRQEVICRDEPGYKKYFTKGYEFFLKEEAEEDTNNRNKFILCLQKEEATPFLNVKSANWRTPLDKRQLIKDKLSRFKNLDGKSVKTLESDTSTKRSVLEKFRGGKDDKREFHVEFNDNQDNQSIVSSKSRRSMQRFKVDRKGK